MVKCSCFIDVVKNNCGKHAHIDFAFHSYYILGTLPYVEDDIRFY